MSDERILGSVTGVDVGRTPDNEKLTLDIRVRRRKNVAPYQTVFHTPCRHYVELTIVGNVSQYGRDVGGGQCIDTLRAVASAEGSTRDPFKPVELLEVANLWERWHLNGMRPWCVHLQDRKVNTGTDVKTWPQCSETGYKWGSAWLVEPIPPDVLTSLEALFGLQLPDVNPQGVEV